MKKLLSIVLILLMISCEQGSNENETTTELNTALNILEAEGFDVSNAIEYDADHVLIEGDILFNISDLLAGPEESRQKQYRTRVVLSDAQVQDIKVRISSGVSSNWTQGVRNAMQRWNNISGTKINFREVNSGEDVFVRQQSVQPGFLAFATFPQSNGRAGYYITLGSDFANDDISRLTKIVTHEMGHTLGLRHSNWWDRNMNGRDDGNGDNEGQQAEGAIHIPGTPEHFDYQSIMNASIGQSGDSFTESDLVAVRYIYADSDDPIDPEPPAEYSVSGPDYVSRYARAYFTVANYNGNATWWYKPSWGNWTYIGSTNQIWVQQYYNYTVAAGIDGKWYFKDVTVY